MGAFDLLAGLTARLASTGQLDDIVDTVLHEIAVLGFGTVWIAVFDDRSGTLSTLRDVVDGVRVTHPSPEVVALDPRQPLGQGFREGRMINVPDPAAFSIVERDGDAVPPGQLALPRAAYDRLRGRPFATGPLLGSDGQPVGALALASYHGGRPIPDELLSGGLLRALIDHLRIALERARQLARLERLEADALVVAHDLNNHSAIALLAIDIGARSPADAFEMLPSIKRAQQAIGDLVGRLQRIARAGAGEAQTLDLRQIVEGVLILAAPILREHSIRVEADLPAVPPVRGDAVVVHQVVLNLVVNARDALARVPPGQRRIQVRLRDDGGVVRLVVADTGPGIAPEVLARLFERFITTKPGAHHGLGLASAAASLKEFGGQIEGRNAPAGGAVFEVTLVAAVPPASAEPPGGSAAEPPGPASGEPVEPALPLGEDPRHARILAVDDDPDVVYFIRAYLEPLGYVVVTATDAVQAIAAAKAQAFDLVLCDLGMPKHSGLDVCRSLRDADYRGKLVLMTGWDIATLRSEQRECDMLLKKPFQGTDLMHAIETLLAM
jgi:signal transduction histidine kinase/CheY-like chemotaxis protein